MKSLRSSSAELEDHDRLDRRDLRARREARAREREDLARLRSAISSSARFDGLHAQAAGRARAPCTCADDVRSSVPRRKRGRNGKPPRSTSASSAAIVCAICDAPRDSRYCSITMSTRRGTGTTRTTTTAPPTATGDDASAQGSVNGPRATATSDVRRRVLPENRPIPDSRTCHVASHPRRLHRPALASRGRAGVRGRARPRGPKASR